MQCAFRRVARAILVVLAIAAMETSALGQGSSATKGPPSVYGLDLKETPSLPSGKAAGAGGTVDGAGHRFQLEHLSLTQPVAVAVVAENPSRPLDVRLAKYNFDSVEKDGRTDSRGLVSFTFRTEGDLRILVRAATAEPTPYSLVVWVGEEFASDVRAPFVPMKQRSGLAAVPWLSGPFAAGVLGGFASAGIAVFLWRPLRWRRKGAPRPSGVALLIVILYTTAAAAQELENIVAALSAKQLADVVKRAGMDKTIETVREIGDAAVKLKNFPPLSPSEISLEEDATPPGLPELPSNCLNSDECRKCFAPANARLTRVLRTLEKLRRLGAWTKTYKDRAITFGSSMASIQGAGLGWAGARNEIDQSYVKFQGIYDAKYRELISSLESSLQDISHCEETVYHEHDWYHRFGFIYVQFMADRYRRTD